MKINSEVQDAHVYIISQKYLKKQGNRSEQRKAAIKMFESKKENVFLAILGQDNAILQAFDTADEAKQYLIQELEKDYCMGGELITYEDALEMFGQDEIITAIEIDKAAKSLAAESVKSRYITENRYITE